MNKNLKVFEVHGLSGLLLLGFLFTGLFCGFVLFPIWVVMIAWNEIIGHIFNGPSINYIQASMLWSIVMISVYLTFKNSVAIKVHTAGQNLNEDEIKEFVYEIEEKTLEE